MLITEKIRDDFLHEFGPKDASIDKLFFMIRIQNPYLFFWLMNYQEPPSKCFSELCPSSLFARAAIVTHELLRRGYPIRTASFVTLKHLVEKIRELMESEPNYWAGLASRISKVEPHLSWLVDALVPDDFINEERAQFLSGALFAYNVLSTAPVQPLDN